jgi:hypothetical protein
MIGNIVAGTLSAGAPPVAPSSYESIATVTVGSGGSSSISFSSIPSTYKHLQVRVTNLQSIGNVNFWGRFNSDTANNYAFHELYGTGSGAAAFATATTDKFKIGYADVSTTSYTGAAIMDVLDYTSTSKNKTVRVLSGSDANGSGFILFRSGLWYKTPEAINSITMFPDSGSFTQYSQFALYGIRD